MDSFKFKNKFVFVSENRDSRALQKYAFLHGYTYPDGSTDVIGKMSYYYEFIDDGSSKIMKRVSRVVYYKQDEKHRVKFFQYAIEIINHN